jgi:hypothetical protein
LKRTARDDLPQKGKRRMIELKVTGSAWSEILEQVGPITGPHMLVSEPIDPEEIKKRLEGTPVMITPAPVVETPVEPPKPAKKSTPKKKAVEAPTIDEIKEVDKVSTPEVSVQQSEEIPTQTAPLEREEVRALCLKLREVKGTGQLKLIFAEMGKGKFDQFTPDEYPALVARVKKDLGE